MSKKIKVPKFLADFYESFNDNYYMSQAVNKLQTDYELYKRTQSKTTVLGKEVFDYIEKNGLETTIETLWTMHLNGYEVKDEVQKYKIVFNDFSSYLDERSDFVLWNASGEWILKPDDFFIECEGYKKSFTMEEIIKNFPALVDNAVKVN